MKRKFSLAYIGISVYNRKKYIRQAPNSLLNQTYKNFELIISDNASTGETKKFMKNTLKWKKR